MDRFPRWAWIGAAVLLVIALISQSRGLRSLDRLATSPLPGVPDARPAVTESADAPPSAPGPESTRGPLHPASPAPVFLSADGPPAPFRGAPAEHGAVVAAPAPGVADRRREAGKEGGRAAAVQDRGGGTEPTRGTPGNAPSAITGWIGPGGPGAPPGPADDTSPVSDAPRRPGAGAEVRDDLHAGEPSHDPAAAPSAPRLSLVPSRSDLPSGSTLWVQVLITEGREVTSVPFHVRFDPGILEYLGARTGPALQAGAVQPILLASVSPLRPGNLAVGLSLAGSSGTYSGSGVLVLLEFRALAPGQAELRFESASLLGATGEALVARIEGCSIRVR